MPYCKAGGREEGREKEGPAASGPAHGVIIAAAGMFCRHDTSASSPQASLVGVIEVGGIDGVGDESGATGGAEAGSPQPPRAAKVSSATAADARYGAAARRKRLAARCRRRPAARGAAKVLSTSRPTTGAATRGSAIA